MSFKIQFISYLDKPHFAMFKIIAKWQESNRITAHKNSLLRMKIFLKFFLSHQKNFFIHINIHWVM